MSSIMSLSMDVLERISGTAYKDGEKIDKFLFFFDLKSIIEVRFQYSKDICTITIGKGYGKKYTVKFIKVLEHPCLNTVYRI